MKILIIDDDPFVTTALKTLLEASQMEVVACGHNGHEAYVLYQRYHPDIVLMDIRMNDLNGVEASEKILQDNPHANILFLTTFQDDEYILKAMKLGIKGYLLKQNFESIVPALQAVYRGQHVFNTEIMEKIPNLLQTRTHEPHFEGLSHKEVQFLTLVAEGLNNKEIAATLYLSEGTVRNYLSALLEKLGLRDRTQLAIYYYRQLQKNNDMI